MLSVLLVVCGTVSAQITLENSIMTRKQIIEGLTSLGIELDEEANDVRGEFRLITKEGSKIPCYIVPTDEELMIARDTYRLIG